MPRFPIGLGTLLTAFAAAAAAVAARAENLAPKAGVTAAAQVASSKPGYPIITADIVFAERHPGANRASITMRISVTPAPATMNGCTATTARGSAGSIPKPASSRCCWRMPRRHPRPAGQL